MDKDRRFERVACNEKVILHCNDIIKEARLRNISINGALAHLNEDMLMQLGDQCLISICLNIFDITLHFRAEVRHSCKNEVGVKFLFMDSDTKNYLNSLLAFRTANPHLIYEEYDNPSYRNGNAGEEHTQFTQDRRDSHRHWTELASSQASTSPCPGGKTGDRRLFKG